MKAQFNSPVCVVQTSSSFKGTLSPQGIVVPASALQQGKVTTVNPIQVMAGMSPWHTTTTTAHHHQLNRTVSVPAGFSLSLCLQFKVVCLQPLRVSVSSRWRSVPACHSSQLTGSVGVTDSLSPDYTHSEHTGKTHICLD